MKLALLWQEILATLVSVYNSVRSLYIVFNFAEPCIFKKVYKVLFLVFVHSGSSEGHSPVLNLSKGGGDHSESEADQTTAVHDDVDDDVDSVSDADDNEDDKDQGKTP